MKQHKLNLKQLKQEIVVFRMKHITISTLGVFLMLVLQITAYAYDFREDTMNALEIQNAKELENGIISSLYQDENDSSILPFSNGLDWDSAKRAYQFMPQVFLGALENGTLEEEILSAHSVWKVPVCSDDCDYAYAIVNVSDEESGYVTVRGNPDNGNPVQYLFDEQPISDGQYDEDEDESVYLISLLDYKIDFVVVTTNEEMTLIPYSSRPDLLKLNNGEAYSSSEVISALSEYESVTAWPASGGGVGGNTSSMIPVVFLFVFSGFAVLGFILRKNRKSGSQIKG